MDEDFGHLFSPDEGELPEGEAWRHSGEETQLVAPQCSPLSLLSMGIWSVWENAFMFSKYTFQQLPRVTPALSCTSDCFKRPPASKTAQSPLFPLKKILQPTGKKTHAEPNSRVWASLQAALLSTAPQQRVPCHSTLQSLQRDFNLPSLCLENRLHAGARFGKQQCE